MERIIEAHGKKFVVEGEGFVKNHVEGDFQKAVDAIDAHLSGRPEIEVIAAHVAHQQWIAADCDGDRPDIFDSLETIGHTAATTGWHRPDAATVSVGTLA